MFNKSMGKKKQEPAQPQPVQMAQPPMQAMAQAPPPPPAKPDPWNPTDPFGPNFVPEQQTMGGDSKKKGGGFMGGLIGAATGAGK